MAKIVLAHGILGFGSVLPSQPFNYFNGIPTLFSSSGHEVLCPTVPALGSIVVRSRELQKQILAKWPTGTDPIFLLAHSMGGLDCRHMLSTNNAIASRVPRLITVATPHYGSPVADAVLHPAFPGLPSPVQWLADFFSADAGALADLQTHAAIQNAGISTVEYLCVGCDASSTQPKSPIFALTAAIGEFGAIPNDGVVSLASASNTQNSASLFETWHVDHGGAIGWPSGGIGIQAKNAAAQPQTEHLARYRKLLAQLVG